jgi:hypothetical protein
VAAPTVSRVRAKPDVTKNRLRVSHLADLACGVAVATISPSITI